MKKFIQEYLSFSRKEKVAVLVLTGIIAFVFLLPSFYSLLRHYQQSLPDSSWFSQTELLLSDSTHLMESSYENPEITSYQYDYSAGYKKVKLFYFNPNTLSREQWHQLGVSEKTINTIQNYLKKGGVFKKPDDLKKIYGLKTRDFERLSPYIQILQAETPATPHKTATLKENVNSNPIADRYIIADINTADTSEFIRLPGIGSKLAIRIVNFRNRLGGFYSVNQIGETYGLHDSVFQKIKTRLELGNTPVTKININTAAVEELQKHPYIKKEIARVIIAYRNEHGNFQEIAELKKIMIISDEVYNKIAPYCTIK